MNTTFLKKYLSILILLTISMHINAHPTGNLIQVGKYLLWSYIDPLDDVMHHACVMIWSEGSKPRVLINSEYPSSDYMLSANDETIYLIERCFFQASQSFQIRLLKMKIDEQPQVIWDWIEDKWRIGEGGFFMLSDDQMVFASYPSVYSIKKGQVPHKLFEFKGAVNRLRAVDKNKILLLGDSSCWLVNHIGTIIHQWENLIDPKVTNPPLNRNRIFDVDYKDQQLLIAYWGKRTFETIDKNDLRSSILQQKEPLTPHWVTYYNNTMMLFSSRLTFNNNESPRPLLLQYDKQKKMREIWTD